MLRTLCLAAVVACSAPAARAGDFSPKAADEVVDQLVQGLGSYFDPAVGKKAQEALKAHRSAYRKLDSREAFAQAVSEDLYAASRDKHLKVSVATNDAGRAARLSDEQQALVDRRVAYGFMAARRLPANIGYLKLRYFEQGEEGAKLMDTLMALLKDTDALIIDLRENTGGGGASDEALLGHLSRTPIPMARITWRNADGSTESWQREMRTPPGGPLYPDKPVFVLTSRVTFSAAEGFVYDLKAVGRAVVVGETTGGGANPQNRPAPLSYGLRVFIPNGHVEHPITHANWEGVGVVPDVATRRDGALLAAYTRALAAAKPEISTPKSDAERAGALADPRAALLADQLL